MENFSVLLVKFNRISAQCQYDLISFNHVVVLYVLSYLKYLLTLSYYNFMRKIECFHEKL
jgi:hypothetical protein